MKFMNLFTAATLVGCAVLLACSGSSNSSGGNSTYTACLAQPLPAACASCIESSCSSQLNTFEGACSDFINCSCPGGNYSATAEQSQTCQSKATSSTACTNADTGLTQCLTTTCTSACTTTSGGSSGGSSGSSGSSSGSVGSTSACGVNFSSASCASCVNTSCCAVTETCVNDAACDAIITCIKACSSTDSTCQNNCATNASSTAQTEFTNMGNCWTTTCGASGC